MRRSAKSAGKAVKAPPGTPDTPDNMTFDEVLEQLLPHFDDDPFKVATWLNAKIQERSGICLLADGSPVSPHICATELTIVAKIAGNGRAVLEVVSQGRALTRVIGHHEVIVDYDKSGKPIEQLRESTEPIGKWTVERKSFGANRPGAPRNLGGREREVDRERLLREALVYSVVHGWPDRLDGDGGLFDKLGARVKNLPARTTLYEIFTPVADGIRNERNQLAKNPKAPI
jgi:hypothetical protein